MDKKDNYLNIIRKKTQELPPFPKGTPVGNTEFYKHVVEDGVCFSRSLFSEDNVSVALWNNEEGSSFPAHVHDEREWLIFFRGKVEIKLSDREETLVMSKGDSITIDPKVVHSLHFLEDTDCVAITIPKSSDFPEGGI